MHMKNQSPIMEMDDNFILEVSTSLEEQASSFQHICMHIFSRNEFVDCTLCCSDGQLQAHRVILASVSHYMHTMLSTTPWPTPCSHPMLFFKSFCTSDMKLALEFIYTGRAKISKNKLPTLMSIARELGCSSLTKAIEKAINCCGVEIFRKRIQNQNQPLVQTAAGVSKTTFTTTAYGHGATVTATSTQNKMLAPNQLFVRNTRSTEQETRDADIFPEQDHDPHQSNDSNQLEDEPICPNEIKIEPGEDMMLELDPSSIVTTIDTSLTNASHSPSAYSRVNEISTGTEGTGVKVDYNLSIATELETNANVGSCEIQVINNLIEMKGDKMTDNDAERVPSANTIESSVHENVTEDVDGDQDDEDEEMPITVVDLKSLADRDAEPEDVIGISSTGIESTDTMPANCPWCFQIFTSLTLLQRHIKTHVGKYKPYSCQYCPASFARSAHLKRHIRTHTGEKPFVCSFCSRAFSRQDKLKTHLEKHLLDQQLQNNTKLINASGFSSHGQNNARSNSLLKTSPTIPSTTATVTGFSPHKQMMQTISTSTNLSQCLPTAGYQYYINEGPEVWQTQADRISKGLIGAPGQITISTAISPSTTITPISSLLVQHTNPPQ